MGANGATAGGISPIKIRIGGTTHANNKTKTFGDCIAAEEEVTQEHRRNLC